MGPYSSFWSGLRRATRFFDRRGHSRPSLGEELRPYPVVRAGPRERGPTGTRFKRLFALAWPAPFIAGVPLIGYFSENLRFWTNEAWFYFLVPGPFILVATVYALAAIETLPIRLIAALLNAAFPLCLGIAWLLSLL